MGLPWDIPLILAGGVVIFGLLYALKEFFDIYFERQEMKARIRMINTIEAHTLITQAQEEAKKK